METSISSPGVRTGRTHHERQTISVVSFIFVQLLHDTMSISTARGLLEGSGLMVSVYFAELAAAFWGCWGYKPSRSAAHACCCFLFGRTGPGPGPDPAGRGLGATGQSGTLASLAPAVLANGMPFV